MAAQTTHLVSKTQSCEFGAFLREPGWEVTRIPGRVRIAAGSLAVSDRNGELVISKES